MIKKGINVIGGAAMLGFILLAIISGASGYEQMFFAGLGLAAVAGGSLASKFVFAVLEHRRELQASAQLDKLRR